jgi:hypothetical protein
MRVDSGITQRAAQRLRRQLDLPAAASAGSERQRPVTSAPPVDTDSRQTLADEGNVQRIANAGLVLLWPFLSRYFAMLGLLEQQQFADEQRRSRAVYLLQYLANGSTNAREPELLLNKLLCGLDSARPPEPAPVLAKAERQASEELLFAVTQSWSKLRNTTIAGLRESFLIRPGELWRKPDACSLTVERRSFDVLLDSLPWHLSVVRLPWMQLPLHVSWR